MHVQTGKGSDRLIGARVVAYEWHDIVCCQEAIAANAGVERSDIHPDFTIADKMFIDNVESSVQSSKTLSQVDVDQKIGVSLCYIFARRVAMVCAIVSRKAAR